jgi:hypothetical protein
MYGAITGAFLHDEDKHLMGMMPSLGQDAESEELASRRTAEGKAMLAQEKAERDAARGNPTPEQEKARRKILKLAKQKRRKAGHR